MSLLLIAPAAAHASTYNWEQSDCYNVMQHCWATNFDPNAGPLGSASKIDNFGQLGQGGYGGGSFNNDLTDLVPASGGDYPRGGGNARTASDCPTRFNANGSACNYSPSQFVTQNYTDTGGNWHFAMGGGNGLCQSNGDVPCNAGQWFFPMDQASSGYPDAQVMPFSWGFPSTDTLQMNGNMYVGGVSGGAFHGFACVQLQDTAFSPQETIEFCDEVFNSAGTYEPVTGLPSCIGTTGSIYWERAGTSNSAVPMTTYANDSDQTGTTLPFGWTVTRDQFITALNNTASHCPGFVADTAMDNWKMAYSETGMETSGNGGASAGISWQSGDISVETTY